MSTRGMFVVREFDGSESFNIYKHHDMYPEGAVECIETTVTRYSWPLPRFEADEFAAALVAASKGDVPGGMRLMQSGHWETVAPRDIAYVYIITQADKDLLIAAYDVTFNGIMDEFEKDRLFVGNLEQFRDFTKKDAA